MPTIRRATLTDAHTFAAIEAECFEQPYPFIMTRVLSELMGPFGFVAEEDGKPLGYSLGALAGTSDVAWILSLAVVPSARKLGLGETLGRRLQDEFENRGVKTTYLAVRPDNTPILLMSERNGFVLERTEEHYFGEGSRRLILKRVSA